MKTFLAILCGTLVITQAAILDFRVTNTPIVDAYLPLVIQDTYESSLGLSKTKQKIYVNQYNELVKQIKNLRSGQTMIMHINSYGGGVAAGQKLIELMKASKGRIICEVTGEADSMAAVLLMESKEIKFKGDHTSVMFHMARYTDDNGYEVILAEEDSYGFDQQLRSLITPILTKAELDSIFIKKKDFEISGKELQIRLCTKLKKAC